MAGGSSLSVMHAWDDHERATLVALLRTRPDGLTWSEIAVEVAEAGSAQPVWERHNTADLFSGSEQSNAQATALADLLSWRASDFRFQTFMDSDYPARLLEVHQFPPVLFSAGSLAPQDVGVSVVGSRRASERGLDHARELARRLVGIGVTVISGLAAGIDTAAHLSALQAGGRTVAVIGTGITECYPAQNRDLQDRISGEGLVMSQFWPDSPPSKSSFPMRNATMSAYGRATIIVEAGETSGARIQARLAVEHGRPVILMDSVVRGTNWGARLRGQPGVLVADTPVHAVEHVEQIVRSEGQISDLLSMTPG
jgi:DNA processing protein